MKIFRIRTMKIMKIKYWITTVLLLLLIAPATAMAQPGDRQERLEAIKIAYLTRELNLSPEEARQFWPLYDKYQDELRELRESTRLDMLEARMNFKDLSDQEVEAMLNTFLDSKQAEIDLTRKYVKDFQTVLPIKKVAKLFRAEHQFKRRLLEEMRNKPGGPGNPGGPPGRRGGGGPGGQW